MWWVVLYVLIGLAVSKLVTPVALREVRKDEQLHLAVGQGIPAKMVVPVFYFTLFWAWPIGVWFIAMHLKGGKGEVK